MQRLFLSVLFAQTGKMGKKGEYLTDRLTDEAVHLIETHGDSPFT